MNNIQRLFGKGIVEKLKAKAFLAQYALEKPSLHWWITEKDEDAQQAYHHFCQELKGVVATADEAQYRITLCNDSTICFFPLSKIEWHQGEAPQTIVFENMEILRSTWNKSILTLKTAATMNTFMINSHIYG